VEQAALVAALEITRDLAVLAVEQQFASNALHDLVTGTAGNLEQALERADRFGWDLRRPLTVLVARHTDTEHRDTEHRGTERGGTEHRGTERGGTEHRGTEPGDDPERLHGHPQEAAALRAVELWT